MTTKVNVNPPTPASNLMDFEGIERGEYFTANKRGALYVKVDGTMAFNLGMKLFVIGAGLEAIEPVKHVEIYYTL